MDPKERADLAQRFDVIAAREDWLRYVRFDPYIDSIGIHFTLETFNCGIAVGYRFTMFQRDKDLVVLFMGNDFNPSVLHAWDGNDSIASLMGFLTLRPGDTDSEYFEHYTPEQLTYCDEHAESLSLVAYSWEEEDKALWINLDGTSAEDWEDK
jgi:hypothetical protein